MKTITFLSFIVLTALLSTVTAQTQLDTPTPGMATRVTLSNFVANWVPVENATSYSINVYDASNTLVSGSPFSASGATTATLSITKSGGVLQPNTSYTFTVTAIGDGVNFLNSPESAKSATFTTATSGSFLLQYTAAEAMTLNADIRAGAADIYELTTSGGIYNFNTALGDNNTMVRSTTIRAASGLASKPIVSLTSTSVSGTMNIFNTQLPNITVNLEGIEFNGINTGSTGQPQLLYAKTTAATNFKAYIKNCYIHDFLNPSGNGVIRLDGFSSTSFDGLVDIQGSIFKNFSGRAIYLNPPTSTTTSYVVNLKNNIFNTNFLLSSRANIIYSTASSAYWNGSITIDHCTFNNLVATSNTECIIRQLTPAAGGSINIKNSIFTTVAGAALYAYVSTDYCYLAGFTNAPLGTNTNVFPASPAPDYTDVATNNFRLTNAASFIGSDGYTAGKLYITLDAPDVSAGGTNPTINTFTARWAAVANASSYEVRVYDATLNQVGSTYNVSAGNTSVEVTGLSSKTSYTYTVTAIGDNLTYFNSSVSLHSPAISTLTTGMKNSENGIKIYVNNKQIRCSETGIIQVFNTNGSLVYQTEAVNVANTNLSSGLYMVKFISSNGNFKIQKVIIQ